MKFLVDRCAGRRLAEWLRRQGHDVVESRERGTDPGDREILGWAAGEGRVLITIDKDFGAFVFGEGSSHCGLVRLPDVPAAKRITIMENILSQFARELRQNAVITVRGERIRISYSPRSPKGEESPH